MNNKAFTLTELLGVIVILSILAVITVPLITGSITSSKKNLHDRQIEMIKNAAERYVTDNALTFNDNQVCVKTLKDEGYLKNESILDPNNQSREIDGCVKVNKTGNNYEYEYISICELYVSSSGNDSTGNGYESKPFATIEKAYSVAEEKCTIYLVNNITLSNTITFDKNKKIILMGKDNVKKTITRSSSYKELIINNKSGQLTLKAITLNGNNIQSTNSMIKNGAKLVLGSNTLFVNNISSASPIINTSNLNIDDAKISNNKFTGSTGGIIKNSGTLTIESGTFKNNTSNAGGLIYNTNSVTINDGEFKDNNAINGAIVQNKDNLRINNGTFSNNTATSSGGVVDNSGTTTIKAGTFNLNTAKTGGVFNSTGTLTIENTTISDNTATKTGGALADFGRATINNVKVINNKANIGGGIYTGKNARSSINKAVISSNIANESGGGIAVEKNQDLAINSMTRIENNSAHVNGGGIYIITSGTVKLNEAIVKKNSAKNQDGGICNNGGTVMISNNSFICYNNTPFNSFDKSYSSLCN